MTELKDLPPEVEREEHPSGWTQVWHCTPPEKGVTFRIWEDGQVWDQEDGKPVRHITKWEL